MKLYEIHFTLSGRHSMRFSHFMHTPSMEDACKALADRMPMDQLDSYHSAEDLITGNGITDVHWRRSDGRPEDVRHIPLSGLIFHRSFNDLRTKFVATCFTPRQQRP